MFSSGATCSSPKRFGDPVSLLDFEAKSDEDGFLGPLNVLFDESEVTEKEVVSPGVNVASFTLVEAQTQLFDGQIGHSAYLATSALSDVDENNEALNTLFAEPIVERRIMNQ